MSLYILRAKPNPSGKDKYGQYAPNSQQNAEWIDIQNTSGKALNMTGVKVYDHKFDVYGRDEGRREVYKFGSWDMPVNTVVRIHSGDRVEISSLPSIDRDGANYHFFTWQPYVWNNVWGDTAEVRNSTDLLIDKASYGRNPTEGAILKRYGDHLI
ncbi:MAG: lamin tail domain-containing protein [Patescibacteria group bacterium]